MEKIIVGFTEKVRIKGKEVVARIDTGAKRNSICVELAAELKLGPIVNTHIIVSPNGKEVRPVIEAEVEISGKKIKSLFNITDRAHMKYRVLIGQEILKYGFLIDPSKSNPE